MKRSLLIVGVAAALMAAWSIGRAQGQQGEGSVVFATPATAKFAPTKERAPTAKCVKCQRMRHALS